MTPELFTTFSTDLAALISSIGQVLTGLVSWSGSFLAFILGKPILLIPCIFGFIGVVVITVRSFLR